MACGGGCDSFRSSGRFQSIRRWRPSWPARRWESCVGPWEGCLAWQRDGLRAPTAITITTDEYMRDSDTLGTFMHACCVELTGVQVRAGTFY